MASFWKETKEVKQIKRSFLNANLIPIPNLKIIIFYLRRFALVKKQTKKQVHFSDETD